MLPAILLFLWQIFGPNDPIIVSRDTTYITAPLRSNRRPDYERYLLEQSKRGITKDNNSAVLLWQAIWPGDLEPSQYQAVCDELGLNGVPSASDAIQFCDGQENVDRIRNWFATETKATVSDDTIHLSIGLASDRPWTANQFPPLAEWVNDNDRPLDLIVEATKRPRYYSPSPQLIDNRHGMVIELLWPGTKTTRHAVWSLSVRAMMRLGENRLKQSWDDVLATHRLSRLVGQGHTIDEEYASFEIADCAHRGTIAILDNEKLSSDVARTILHELLALPSFRTAADSLNSDRIMVLDSAIHAHAGSEFRNFSKLSADWNLTLREANEWFDRTLETMAQPMSSQRIDKVKLIEKHLDLKTETRTGQRNIFRLLNRKHRSEYVAAMFISNLKPSLLRFARVQTYAEVNLELSRLSAALAVYRAEHGTYPDKLDALVPGVIPEVPVDLCSANSLIYKPEGDCYLLYSRGINGIDDGGSNEQFPGGILKGRELNEIPQDEAKSALRKIPPAADDISIRLPRPPFKLPTPPTGEL
jgi:hypothetical protein